MQLVAYGAQDIYLTGNPQITFFKVVYRRHTNFSMETIEQTINGGVSGGGSSTVTISRNGDLVYKIYVTNTAAATNGSEIVSEVELEIGGQRIDRHYAEWNQIWNELSTPESKAVGLKSMVGDLGTAGSADSTGPLMTQYPLNFWFCRNPGLALPLIALQYHEVKLKFTWGAGTAQGVSSDAKVLCDYIYLDTDERRRFAQVSHEYLIEQLQKESFGASDSQKLNFNHPVKELVWTSQASSGYRKAQLKLNGHDRFSAQESEYFQLRQPFDYHTAVPAQNLPISARSDVISNAGTDASDLGFAEGIADIDSSTAGVPTLTDFNFLTINGAATGTPADGAVAAAGSTDSAFLAVLGTSAGTVFPAGSVAIGDTHIVEINNVNSAAKTRVIAKVSGLFEDTTSGGTIPVDGTGPVKAGEAAVGTVETDASTHIVGTLIIQYDKVVNTETLEDGDTLKITILKASQLSARTSKLTKNINVYSFALKPEEHQPSGTCNFSRIDTAKLDFSGGGTAPTSEESIYAVNYNVLRIMSGMGGLAYSN